MKLPPLFVINLKTSTERKEHIQKQLSDIEYDFEFIEAVDGSLLSQTELGIYDKEATLDNWTNRYNRELSKGEIGCIMSHLLVYKKMIDENIEEAIILEDDVTLKQGFLDVIEIKERFPQDWMVIWLCHESQFLFSRGAPTLFRNRLQLCKNHKLARFAEYPWVGSGYLIKKDAAQQLLDFAYPIRMPADILLSGNCGELELKMYGIAPPCITPARNLLSVIG